MKQLFIISLLLTALSSHAQLLKQIEKGTTIGQVPITNGPAKTMVYRNLDQYLDDSLHYGKKIDSLRYNNDSLKIYQDGQVLSVLIESSSFDTSFNGNRVITNPPLSGVNLGTTSIRGWMEALYKIPYTQPTLTMNSISPTLVEVGYSGVFGISGSTSNPCSMTLSGGAVNFSGYTFGSATSYSTTYTYSPTTPGTTTLTASQAWSQTGSTCLPGSPTSGTKTASRTLQARYPIFWFMSPVVYGNGSSIPYISTTEPCIDCKRLTACPTSTCTTSSNQTSMEMTGTNEYIYIVTPATWSDIVSIIDHNGFNVTSSFTKYTGTMTSTGWGSNWTISVKIYKLNSLTTATDYNYSINF